MEMRLHKSLRMLWLGAGIFPCVAEPFKRASFAMLSVFHVELLAPLRRS